jgi:UDP-N-acetylmuramate--alanine ligase
MENSAHFCTARGSWLNTCLNINALMYDKWVDRPLRIFFSGIAGSGVSAIASFMAEKGNVIVGSDRAFDLNPDHPLKKLFRSEGISVVPQDGNGLNQNFDFAVFSTAVESGCPEVLRARDLKIPVKKRPEYLTEITSSFRTIAVAGTSGKSTASGLLAFLMKKLGLNPNFIGGGRVKQFRTASHPGNSLTGSSDYLVIEACESDGSIVNYKPENSIILNLSLDHHSVQKTSGMFEVLMENTKNKIIVNADDMNLTNLVKKDYITFSIDSPSSYRANDIELKPLGSEFTVNDTRFMLSLPGKYNIYNALPCIAFLAALGITTEAIADVIPEFKGIERRFDIHLNDGKRLVIDDYAHNPHKIAALMDTVSKLKDRVCYIFQPHGFGPTRMMKKEYIETFSENLRITDHLILLPIFYAGGTANRDISSHDLAVEIKAAGKSVEVMKDRDDILRRTEEWDSYVILGARDDTLSEFATQLSDIIIK